MVDFFRASEPPHARPGRPDLLLPVQSDRFGVGGAYYIGDVEAPENVILQNARAAAGDVSVGPMPFRMFL